MTNQDMTAFNRSFNSLADLYNLDDYEDRRVQYFHALQDMDIAAISAAFVEAASRAGTGSCRFFPLPGVIRNFAYDQQKQQASANAKDCRPCESTGWLFVPTPADPHHAVKPCPSCRGAKDGMDKLRAIPQHGPRTLHMPVAQSKRAG